MLPRIPLHVKLNVRPLDVAPRQLRRLQSLDFLLPRSRLRGTRARGEPRDKLLQLRNFFLAIGVVRFDAPANLRFGHHHVVIPADVHDDRLVVDVRSVRADAIQKVPVVRNDNQHAFIFAKIPLQPMYGIEVQVVRRLVQQQRGRISKERLCQQHANFLSALQFAHLAFVQFAFHAQAIEQHRRIGFRRITALLSDDALEFAKAHPVRVRQLLVRLGVQCVALFEGFP